VVTSKRRKGLNEELINILDKNNEKQAGLLTENKIVNIKILQNYLDSLDLHRPKFEMNKFVVKQKRLKNVTNLSSKTPVMRSSYNNKPSIFNSYKQAVLEGTQDNFQGKSMESFYKRKESSSLFSHGFHKYDSFFHQELKPEDYQVSF
jgi:hypothetical protein